MNGWEVRRWEQLIERVEALEKIVSELDARTGGFVRLGPQEYSADPAEIERITNRILESIPPRHAEPSGLIPKFGKGEEHF